MPSGDGTGPDGIGPMTGRGLGYCTGYSTPGFMTAGVGIGMARRRGFGRGLRWRVRMIPVQQLPTQQPQQIPVQQLQLTSIQERLLLEQERKNIEQEIDVLKSELKKIQEKFKSLEIEE